MSDPQTGIYVQPAQRDTWMQHLHRGRMADLDVTHTYHAIDLLWPATFDMFHIASRTVDQPRTVSVSQFSSPVDGLTITVSCDCPAGQADTPCCHAALGLLSAGLFPFPVLPTTITIGIRVRITSGRYKGRVGVVDSLHEDKATVIDPDAREPLGRHLTKFLVPTVRDHPDHLPSGPADFLLAPRLRKVAP